MTKMLERAIAEAKKLPDGEQDVLATLILDEIQDEKRWEDAFARSQGKLAQLASKAREEVQSGRGTSQGIDEL